MTDRYRARRLSGQGDRWKRQIEAEKHRKRLAADAAALAERRRRTQEWNALPPEERQRRIATSLGRLAEGLRQANQRLSIAAAKFGETTRIPDRTEAQ